MNAPLTPNLPTDADLDAVAEEQAAKEQTAGNVVLVRGAANPALVAALRAQSAITIPNPAPGIGPEGSATVTAVDPETNEVTLAAHPQATAPAHPQPEVQTSAPGVAPESLPNPTSHGHGEKGGPTAPSLDTEVFDDAGNEKTDQGIADEGFGPRGHNIPRDVMSDAERQQQADDAEAKLKAGLAPTNVIDSTGAPKGAFQVTPQGHDKHGMRLPDKIDTTKVMEPVAAHVGPSGVGAPQDCFHGPRPEKK